MLEKIQSLEIQIQTTTDPRQRIDCQNDLIWMLGRQDLARVTMLLQKIVVVLDRWMIDGDPYAVGVAAYSVNLARLYSYQDQFDKGLVQAHKAIAQCRKIQQFEILTKALEVAGICNIRLGNQSEALTCITEGLTIAAAYGYRQQTANLYNTLAIVYVNLSEHAQGAAYFERSLHLCQEVGDIYGEARALSNLCMSYKDLGNYAESLRCGAKGLELAHQLQSRLIELWLLGNLANTYTALGESEKAFAYFQQAAYLAQQSGSNFEQASTLLSMARAFYKEQKFDLALSYAQLVLEIAESSKQQGFQFEAHELLAMLYKQAGKFAEALDHYEKFHTIKESIFTKEASAKLKQIEVGYRTDAMEKEAEIYQLRYVELQREIAARERTQKALIQAQKLESMGVLAGGIAHDFNNLLVGILGQTDLALRKLSEDHPARRNLLKTNQSAERAASLALKMLAYSGRGKFQVARCTLGELITESRELWLSAVGTHCQLNFNLTDYSLLVEIDKSQIQQLLTNLIMNAAEAEAQTITVRSACQTIGAEDSHYWQYTAQPLTAGAYGLIAVEDDGIGMSAATLEKIFDPFFTTKFTGRGLGLAAGLGIVRGHMGGVAVQSQLGVGTTIQFLLPIATGQELIFASTRDECAVTLDALKLQKILVIDDQADVRETIAETLAHYQIQVVTCADGLSAIDYYTANKAEIDLVLLDLTMPGLNGLQVWQQLRTIEPTVKVILSSGYNTVDVLERIEESIEILQKPYRPEALVKALCKCFN